MEPDARPWPPQLVTKPAAEPPTAVSDHRAGAARPPASPTHESVDHDEGLEGAIDSAPDGPEPEATSAEAVTDQTAGSVDQPPTAPPTPATTKRVVEAGEPDEPEAGLELFASEPAPDGDDQPDDKDPLTAGTGDRDDTKGYVKSLYRRLGGGAS